MTAPEASPLVRFERREAVALLTIDNPPVNVLSAAVLDALSARLREVESDPAVRAVVLNGAAEKAFAAGANIREMEPMGPAEALVHGGRGQAVTRQIEKLPLPVIAAVHGSCLGGGCELALACDFIIASEDAVFGQPEIKLGVMPGWGGTRRLPRRIGAARARFWIYSGRPVPAAQALSEGLLLKVVPRSHLLSEAIALADELAQQPPVALAAAKYALSNALDGSIDMGLAYELDLWSNLFGTADQKAGMSAFLGKRPFASAGREEWARRSQPFPWAMAQPRGRKSTEGVAKDP
ncbi:MAG: enoyl-CoA hydratase/isomerase family protein [Candidatus Lutacidiplasmatales archaeon]